MNLDSDREFEAASDLMDEIEALIISKEVSYATALSACAGIHNKIMTFSLAMAFDLQEEIAFIADIVTQESDDLVIRVKDQIVESIIVPAGEPVN